MATLIFILFALLGVPLFAMFGGVALYSYDQLAMNPIAIISEYYKLASQPVLLTIPLFTFAGYMLAESNAPTRLVNVARSVVGWMPGGLAIVTLFACAFFTAFTGASGVTIIALGGLLYPILIKENYPDKFAMGLVTCCGSLGLLFPPSLPLILYGLIGGVSIDKLFIAGILPGIVLIVILATHSIYTGKKINAEPVPFKIKNVLTSFRAAIWELPLPAVILVGIYGGFITVSEAASVAAFYVFIVEVFIYRDLKIFTDIPRIIQESMILVGGILIILGVAMGMTNMFIDQEVPFKIFGWVSQFIHSKWAFLVALNLFLLVVGCLMDIFSAIIVVVPIITPIALKYGVNPIHLAIIFLTNLEIGYLTPPVGLNLFISSFRFKRSIFDLYRVSLPFLVLLLAALMVLTYIPWFSMAVLEFFGM
ncbi:MAG: TRAP transporter large permease [Deltaproteobacteria bacterium]|nr:TRAP transporter large permease [Deltaproteobacteria bacterium]